MATIEYEIIGDQNFLRASEYRMYISNHLKDFETKFLLAENVFIRFEESINPDPKKPDGTKLEVSDDKKSIKLIYKTPRHLKGKEGLSKPSRSEFFKGLIYYMENTVVADDRKRFEQLNNKEEEE